MLYIIYAKYSGQLRDIIIIVYSQLSNLGNVGNFTPLYELVPGLVVLVQHHIEVRL